MASPSIIRAQVRKRSNTPSVCPHHQGNRVVYVCLRPECNNSFACAKCVTSNHQGHKLEELTEFAALKKNSLKDKVKHSKEKGLDLLHQKINTAKQKIDENKTNTAKDVDKIVQRCNEIKAQLDNICQKYTALRKKVGDENDRKLSKHRECLETLYTWYKAELEGCEGVIEEGTDCEVILAENEFPASPTTPDLPETDVFQFKCKVLFNDQLEPLFGQLLPLKVNAITLAEQGATASSSHNSQTMSRFVLKRNTSGYCSYLYVLSDHLYVWSGLPTISLITKDGKEKKKVTLQPGFEKYGVISFVCVSHIDKTIWSMNTESAIIMQITADGTRLQTLPPLHASCICVARNKSVIVGDFDWSLKVFTATGEFTNEISAQDTHVAGYSRRIVQCQKTGRFALTDDHTIVSVLDEKYRHQYTLLGEETVTAGNRKINTGYKTKQTFSPEEIRFDKDGDLLVTDRNNLCVLLFSDRGQYTRTIIQETHKDRFPCAIATDPDGTLWVARQDNVFMQIKYK